MMDVYSTIFVDVKGLIGVKEANSNSLDNRNHKILLLSIARGMGNPSTLPICNRCM